MPENLLDHLDEAQIRHQLLGFPETAVETVLALKRHPSPESLLRAILHLLSFYLPKGADRDLSCRPPESRLREDLGVDSLTFAEAAFKMEELFGIRIENAELSQIRTLGELSDFARRKWWDSQATPAS